jgi:hypothetical protein
MEFVDKNWNLGKRQPVQSYTRVMWYLRPVNYFNLWKKSEFYSRKYFNKLKAYNKHFVSEYMSDVIY